MSLVQPVSAVEQGSMVRPWVSKQCGIVLQQLIPGRDRTGFAAQRPGFSSFITKPCLPAEILY
ncbi:hypothetical protein QNM99_23660 [Pseudomonas sp. PCH446]